MEKQPNQLYLFVEQSEGDRISSEVEHIFEFPLVVYSGVDQSDRSCQ